jgi:hypothetical protein
MVQKTSGANITQMPIAAVIHCIHCQRRYMPRSANRTINTPESISLIPRRMLRMAGSAISCPNAGGSGAVTGSNNPTINGEVMSQSPSAALVIGAQKFHVRCRSIATSTSSSLRSSGALSRSVACASSGSDAATAAGSNLFFSYQSVGSSFSRRIISGSVVVRLCRGSQSNSIRAREMSIS